MIVPLFFFKKEKKTGSNRFAIPERERVGAFPREALRKAQASQTVKKGTDRRKEKTRGARAKIRSCFRSIRFVLKTAKMQAFSRTFRLNGEFPSRRITYAFGRIRRVLHSFLRVCQRVKKFFDALTRRLCAKRIAAGRCI